MNHGSLRVVFPSAVGNEANVEVYANYTGFMWESAKDFGALVVFAEVCEHNLQASYLPE